jgi:hypothetical protein
VSIRKEITILNLAYPSFFSEGFVIKENVADHFSCDKHSTILQQFTEDNLPGYCKLGAKQLWIAVIVFVFKTSYGFLKARDFSENLFLLSRLKLETT